jgi:hypothetical protein
MRNRPSYVSFLFKKGTGESRKSNKSWGEKFDLRTWFESSKRTDSMEWRSLKFRIEMIFEGGLNWRGDWHLSFRRILCRANSANYHSRSLIVIKKKQKKNKIIIFVVVWLTRKTQLRVRRRRSWKVKSRKETKEKNCCGCYGLLYSRHFCIGCCWFRGLWEN